MDKNNILKVFLVEDEVVMRNGIKNNIPWEKEGFQFVGEASDGELAYPLIKREKPDILITDIRMPFMDGLELSRLIKKEMPQIKIIILSGYNEFDYAKSAIQIGVTDYLLKPISSAKLLEAVKKVADMIEKEQEQVLMLKRYEKEMQENTLRERYRVWKEIVSSQVSVAELTEHGKAAGIDFTAAFYKVFLFKLNQNRTDKTILEGYERATEAIAEMSGRWENVLAFDRSPDGWIFLLKGDSEAMLLETEQMCRSDLLLLLAGYSEIEYFGGIGCIVNRLSDVQKSYRDATKAFSGRFFTDQNQIIDSESLPSVHQTDTEKIDLSQIHSKKREREQIDRFLRNGIQDEVDTFLEEYFLEIGSENMRSLIYRQYVVMDLYFATTDFLKGIEMDITDLPDEQKDINRIVGKCTSEDKVKEVAAELFTETIRLRENRSKKKYGELLEEAKQYIGEHYQSEDMSLNTVATEVNMSPSYFSSVFSNEMGQTFVEYLTEVRMEKAKELLMCSKMRTSEIGYEVGYKDPHYFSYIFKKVVGCTPKDFRNRGKDTE